VSPVLFSAGCQSMGVGCQVSGVRVGGWRAGAQLLNPAAVHSPTNRPTTLNSNSHIGSGVNDTDDDARRLLELTRNIRCKINL